MGAGWQISAVDLSETLRPAFFALAALVSSAVLFDALRRDFTRAHAAAWTLTTLALPHVFLPLYLAARLFAPRPAPHSSNGPTEIDGPDETANANEPDHMDETAEADEAPRLEEVGGSPLEAGLASTETDEGAGGTEESPPGRAGWLGRAALRWRKFRPKLPWRDLALPLAYAAALLALGAAYFATDARGFDAHFARAKQAKLYGDRDRAMREYRAALELRDDARSRELLGLELLEAGRSEEALAEFRAAHAADPADETIAYREAAALDALARRAEAEQAYRKFLTGETCRGVTHAAMCEAARARLGAGGSPPAIEPTR